MATWEYRGYRCELNGASYNCPMLSLYGYRSDTALHAAMRRAIAIRTKGHA